MNLRFVEAFHWVAQLRSVTLAAEKLCLTQSAVSSRITALEEELGTPLLVRGARPFRLTSTGIRFQTCAQKLLAVQRQLKAELASAETEESTIRIGAIEAVLHSWLIPLVERLRASHRKFEFELTVEATPLLLDQLRRGALDLVFAAQPDTSQGLCSKPIPAMEMVFVGNPKVHRKRAYSLDQLAALDILTFQRGSQPHAALIDLFCQSQLVPKRVQPVSSISAMTQLVEGGFGIATLPRDAAMRFIGLGSLRELPCQLSMAPLPLFATYRANPRNSLVQAAIKGAGG